MQFHGTSVFRVKYSSLASPVVHHPTGLDRPANAGSCFNRTKTGSSLDGILAYCPDTDKHPLLLLDAPQPNSLLLFSERRGGISFLLPTPNLLSFLHFLLVQIILFVVDRHSLSNYFTITTNYYNTRKGNRRRKGADTRLHGCLDIDELPSLVDTLILWGI